MSKFCPEWLVSATVALVAQRYLASPLELNLFARKYAQTLSERYADIRPDMIEQSAEGFLRVLFEAGAEDAESVLHSYAFGRITRTDLAALAVGCIDNPECINRIYHAQDDSLSGPRPERGESE